MGFTLEHIHHTINSLGRLMPAKPNTGSTREYSLKECIFLMSPRLLEKREMGCTTNELLKALMDDGIEIKAPTLNRYLCEYQKIHGEEAKPNPPEKQERELQAGGTITLLYIPDTLYCKATSARVELSALNSVQYALVRECYATKKEANV